eukprot:CAMPEP_0201905982 /NCGR_PEP_ID=MMETSP0902-20130614/56788_1 /ASSEMBLY_ACC=CAM_ASM_000551 /TAXON_ID=420261 /ORGANISM="Thalassiosira antarctica, Strain CCMP982" /LENGTH=179 /DNA_ID=CAMNT_0048440107 /DNA_START=644 /DNA_END=1181 /DNA_ORIENTATION=+
MAGAMVGILMVVQRRGGRGGIVVGGVTMVIVVLARGIGYNTQCLDARLRSSARHFAAATASLLDNFGVVSAAMVLSLSLFFQHGNLLGRRGHLTKANRLVDIGVSSEGLTEWIFLLFFAAGTGVTLTRKTPTRLAAGATLDAALNTADPTTAACFLLFFSLLKPQYRCGLLTFLTVLLA